ncbi:MAG: hypothetical protein GY722_01945 [bacterium]|nr:hypothetical protein [bacterium]
MTPYELKLAPLPCWRNLPRAEIRKRVAQIVAETEAAAAQLREELGTQLVGMEKIRRQNPLDRPTRSKSAPKPPCHAASKTMRERFRQAYRAFVTMFRTGEEFDPLADAGGSRSFAALLAAAT